MSGEDWIRPRNALIARSTSADQCVSPTVLAGCDRGLGVWKVSGLVAIDQPDNGSVPRLSFANIIPVRGSDLLAASIPNEFWWGRWRFPRERVYHPLRFKSLHGIGILRHNV